MAIITPITPVLTHSASSSSSLRSFASAASSVFSSTEDVDYDYRDAKTIKTRLSSSYKEEGLRHIHAKLSARRYKTAPFGTELLHIIQSLAVPSWTSKELDACHLHIHKVSGSLTNAVFFVSYKESATPSPRTLLLRIYGASSGSLISRPHELHILHVLSSQYRIGPRVFGTFSNGRLEEYFESDALDCAAMRDPQVSRWIGMRMAELHRVDIAAVAGPDWRLGVVDNVAKWLPPAREVLSLLPRERIDELGLDLDRFESVWQRYVDTAYSWEAEHGVSPRVFAHNDAQYGNLLRLRKLPAGKPAHHQIIVVDFEYASPNCAAFDIANHFHEWTTAYQSDTPHLLDTSKYPTLAERQNFYRAYLGSEDGMELLEEQVRVWSAASHGMWSVWAIVQAREQVEDADGEERENEFDYLGYASARMKLMYSTSARVFGEDG